MHKILCNELPNMPWEEKPEGFSSPIWRYSGNPVIKRDLLKTSNSIFNSAVVPFNGGFAGVFRCDDQCRSMDIHVGFSDNGIDWNISEDVLTFEGEEDVIKKEYRYDPRVCFIEDRYYITWCNGYHGPTIGVAYTFDFKTFHQIENSFLPYNRNGVLFPRKIGGEYMMLSRPSDTGHTPFGTIFISRSKDMVYWGKHRFVIANIPGNESAWQSTKIGAGPTPIETDEGWIMIYHGVLNSCNGFVYSFGAAILDRDEPWKVKYRSKPYLMSPQTNYECVGDVPNVCFPCTTLQDSKTGRIAVYYGGADTVTGLAFTTVDELTEWIKNNNYNPAQ